MTLRERALETLMSEEHIAFFNKLRNDELVIDRSFRDAREYSAMGYEPYTGLTKVVFIFDDFVIKKSFSKKVMWYNETVKLEDACQVEYEVYKKAKEYGLEDFFFEVDYLDNGIYVQEKCSESLQESREDYNDDVYPEWVDRKLYTEAEAEDAVYDLVEELSSEERDVDFDEEATVEDVVKFIDSYLKPECVANFCSSYDSLRMIDLAKFLYRYDVTDIHDANVGFDDDYRLRIFDFSGYHSMTKENLSKY